MPTGMIDLFAPKMSSCQYNFSGDYRDVHSLIGQGLHQCIDIVKQMLPTDGGYIMARSMARPQSLEG